MKLLVDSHTMKTLVIVLFVLACRCSCQPIVIKDGQKAGSFITQFDKCSSGENGTLEAVNFGDNLFTTVDNGSKISVLLARDVNLKNDTGFKNVGGPGSCIKQVELFGRNLTYRCKNEHYAPSHGVILELNSNQITSPHLCHKDCTRIVNPLNFTVSESTPVNTNLLNFSFCDDKVYSSSSSLSLRIREISGGILEEHAEQSRHSLLLHKKLDYEKPPKSLTSIVSVKQSNYSLTINIEIEDADDQGIAFNKNAFNCSIPENKGSYVTDCIVHADDLDTGIKEKINYTLLSVTPPTDQLFQILQNGSLKLLKPLDREKVAVYYLGIKGFQRNDYNRENFTSVIVNVVDVDDNLPEMMQPQYNVSVMENSQPGMLVCKVSASDKDIGENAAFKYHISGNNSYFNVNDTTGLVTVNSSIDREKTPSFNFKVYAQAVHNSTRRSNFGIVFVAVVDENDNSPVISSPLVKNISKTRSVDSVLMQINVSDPDEGVNGDVNCSISSPTVPFEIKTSNKTCVISLKETLNETKQLQFTFDLGVHDMAMDTGKRRSTSARVTVDVIDENIHIPEFGSFSRSLNVSESAGIGTILVALTASDKDPTDKLIFNITSYDVFGLDNKNRIYLKQSLDRERNTSYSITVIVFDGKHSKNTAIELKVLDVNDNAPKFENSSYTFNTLEEIDNPNVGRVKATDIDQKNTCNSQIEYSIDKDSPWGDNVTVNKSTGIISAYKIDREKLTDGDKISFFVFAQNCGTPVLTSRTFVTITIDDINDNKPKFENTDVKIQVEEETSLANLTNIYTVKAKDIDEGKNAEIVYHLQDDGKGLVSIDSKTGILRMLKVPLIDVECTNQSFSFNVTAVNKVPYVQAKDIQPIKLTIVIKDKNNHSPKFELRKFPLSKRELGYMYPIVSRHPPAKDDDCEPYFNNITFHLADGSDERLGMNESTGQFYFKFPVDYSFPQCDRKIDLNMYATDGWRKTYKNTTLKLLVSASPAVPIQEQYTFRVTEGIIYTTSHTVGFLDCIDIDLKLHINDTHFDIQQNGKNGTIVVKEALDYETEKIIWAEVMANKTKKSSCIVKIIVEDINDESPHFTNATYTFTIKENRPIGTIVGTVSATDIDTNSNLTYGIVGLLGNTYLNIASDGILKSTKQFDLEDKDAHFPLIANISVSDGKHKIYGKVIIEVEHVNEYSPEFEAENFNFSVNENEQRTWNITATDKDVGGDGKIAHYSVHVKDKWKRNISVNKQGQITVQGLDREAMGPDNKIIITVEAQDGGQPSRTGITFVSVTVKGMNEHKPEFPSGKRNVSVYLKESPKGYQNIYQSKAYDSDIGVGSEIFYRLKNGSNMFDINNTTGVLSSKGSLLIDDANNGKITVIVEAYNKENTTASSIQTIVIYLEDINNNAPVFLNMPWTKNLNECIPLGKEITRINATDADASKEYNTVSFWIEDYNDIFHIDSSTGIIYLVGSLDVDSPSSRSAYNITIYATDDLKYRNKSSDHTVKSTLLLEVLDCNDNAPVFTKDVYSCVIRENKKGLFSCGVEAKDEDKTPSNITYTLIDKRFTINDKTGNLSASARLDFESVGNQTFILNVSASDGKFHVYSSVTVNVINVNDETPKFSKKIYNFRISESNTTKLIVGQIPASDKDGDLNKLQYTLIQTKVFDIGDDGYIITKVALDYEVHAEYNLTAIVNDSKNVDTATVLIHILPVNEYPPIFNSNYTWTITENTKVTKKIQATDKDIGDNKPITYRALIPMKWTNNISFDSASGIFTLTNIDREALGYNSIIRITAEAIDGGTPQRTGLTIIQVTVKGVNDEGPTYPTETRNVTLHLKEGETYQHVYTSKAFDADIGVGAIVFYRLVKGNGTFSIDKDNGTISTKDKVWITKSNKGILRAEIEAFNDDGSAMMKDTQHITVILQDINNNKPAFIKSRYTKKLDECTSPGTKILRVNATDADTKTEFNTVFYWMQDYNKTFYVDHVTGDLFLVGPLDYDSPHSVTNFTFKIYATDDIQLKDKSIFTTIEVNVTNCNDNPPVFTEDFYECEVKEDKTGNFNCPLQASDLDGDTLMFEIINSSQTEHFRISANGTLSVVTTFNFDDMDTKEMFLNVSASDKKYTSYTTVLVNIIDQNDERPVFEGAPYVFNITENMTVLPHLVGSVRVSDVDSKFNLSLNKNCTDTYRLSISENGDIMANTAFDFENGAHWIYCEIFASDTFGENVQQNLSIHIIDINDNAPVFTNDSTSTSVSENATEGTFVIKVSASDADVSSTYNQITYNIFGGNDLELFEINRTTGTVSTKQSLSKHGGDDVFLIVSAKDNGEPPLTAYRRLKIHIQNENIHSPIFQQQSDFATVEENNGTVEVLQVFATDEDGDNLNFTVLNHTNIFHFNNNNLFATALDAEAFRSTDGQCYVKIQVSDGTYVAIATVNVIIIDINDNAPYFANAIDNAYNLTLNDTTEAGENVLNISAQDSDITNKGFTFILYGGEGDFEIDDSSGRLKLIKAFGRNGKLYNMSVTVIDHGNPPKLSAAKVLVTVIATNLNWQFNSSFVLNFSENSKYVQASIAATSDNGITYEIISKKNHDIFKLNKSTGLLTIANETNLLNYEKQPKYEFVVSARDGAVFQRTLNASVTINVIDVNEAPYITKYDKQVFVQENTTANTVISKIEALDPDKNDQLSFTLSDTQNFAIDVNGDISVKTTLFKGNYSLTIQVKDNAGLTANVTTFIIVPAIEFLTSAQFDVFENESVPFLISNLTTELYGMQLVYSIIPSPFSEKFSMKQNGSLILVDDLDREIVHIVNLHIQGKDVSHGILITDDKISVTVKDVNDCQPGFLSSSYTVTIDDVIANETTIAYIEAVDKDADKENRDLTYSVVGNYIDTFSMVGNMLKVDNSSSLEPQQYNLTVSVTDGIFESNTSVIVIVVDTNNHSPVFSRQIYNFAIAETNETSVFIGTVSADDKDDNRNGEISFTLTAGNEDSIFEINSTMGTIQTVKAIDREVKDKYILTVAASDHGNNPRTSTTTVEVHVRDVNDNTPEFKGAAFFNASIQENSPHNTPVVIFPKIDATDKDLGTNGTDGIIYRLNDTVPFCINETKPTIFVCGDLDREKKDLYYLEVIALDSNGNNGSLNTSAPLTIHIIDVNDETPQFTEVVYTFNVSENTDTLVNIGDVSATDEDLDGNKPLRYNIVAGDEGKFYVDTFSGMIYAGGNIDRENQSTFTLNVSAFDGFNRNYTEVKINVIDVNDNPPQFEMLTFEDAFNVNVVEEDQSGIIFNATAYDPDEINSDNSKITFSINVSDTDNETDLFVINKDGGLNLTKHLDREKHDHYEVTIIATDNGSPRLSSSLHVHVTVLDINDNSPEFCLDGRCDKHVANCSTVEKAPVSSVLILLGSKDLDYGENATVSYSVEKSNISKYFRIDNETGVVYVADALVVNNLIKEGMPHSNDTAEVHLTVIATDGGGRNTTLTLNVFVEPINDADVPVFKESPFKFNVDETNMTGVPVGSCIATTNDTLSRMAYDLISGYDIQSEVFTIDPKTGNITTVAKLDREKTDRYIYAVQVRDGRIPERTAFAAVEITIKDVNDNSPVFKNDNITISVLENSTIFTVTSVAAIDGDIGQNGEISYMLNNNNSLFNINENGEFTINGTFNYEQKKHYELVVTAKDKGIPPRNSTAEVHIVVIDVNDNSPIFENVAEFYNVTLPENRTPSEIFTVNATDLDSGWNGKVVYKLQNIEDIPFGIDPFNGTVYLQGQLDYETKTNYTLCIVAQDLGSPALSTMKDVTVYVEDVYDYKIMFKKDIFDINITPTTALNESLLNLTVSVPEAYFSLKGKDSEYFNIGKRSGELSLTKSTTAERQLYVIQVIATDGHGQNASCTVIAHVLAHEATFNTSEIQLHLMENINKTSVLIDLNTTAEFSGNGTEYMITKVIPTGMDLFAVDHTTGVLKCNKPLDREKHSQYTIFISAHASVTRGKRDIPRPSSTIKIIVNVGDVNDNPPQFTLDQERTFGVPDNVRANYIVGKIQAEDPDTSDVGKLRYNVTDGSTDVFGVNRETGEIRTLVAIASTRSRKFDLSISVSDGNILNKKATINITILVVPTKDQPILSVDMSVDKFNKKKDTYRSNMSDILGVNIQFEKIEAHREVDSNGVTHLDLSRTDLIFHGIDNSSGLLVPNKRMKELINSHLEELAKLFHQKELVVSDVMIDVIADPSAISATQILFICMAVFIFFGSLAALVVAQYSWTRYETERKEAEKEAERINNEVELSTIRSRQSSKLSSIMAATAINPVYDETEFLTSNGQLSPKRKDEPQYESQELRVNFEEEPLEAILNAQGLVNASQSVIDSGVGNTSIHSEGNRPGDSGPSSGIVVTGNSQTKPQMLDVIPGNDDGPDMTSSPRISHDENKVIVTSGPEDEADENNTSSKNVSDIIVDQGKRSRGASFLLLDATGESETDDNIDDDVENSSKAEDEPKEETKKPDDHEVATRHGSEGSQQIQTHADRKDGSMEIDEDESGAKNEEVPLNGESANDEDVITENLETECTSF